MADDIRDWIGRTETTADVAAAAPYQRLAGLLDHRTPPWRQGEAPLLGHWLNFLPNALESEIGSDGHPKRGGFLPPVALPRRMWAGSRLTFSRAIPLGASIERRSTIKDVQLKLGRSGEMVFVTAQHEIWIGHALAVTEAHDIVYREAPNPNASGAAPAHMSVEAQPVAEWSRTVTLDPVLLFRYSALTYNGHRIHYDRDFCRKVEGYPGLVVHGPLIATLLMDHYLRRHPGAPVRGFRFRAQSPLFDVAPFDLHGVETEGGAELWASGEDGRIAMKATVEV